MNKRRIFLHSLNRFRMAGAVIAVMLFAACDDEETMGVRSNGDTICFNPMQQTDEWNELPQSRSTGNAHSEDTQSADTTYVVKLDCETPDGKPLYLHVQVTDGIECAGTEAMTEDAPATRGVQVTGADNFHNTFGMYAVSYEQWNPTQDYNLMRNLKVEKQSNWQTDIKWPTKGRVDFYAYAPHRTGSERNFNITYSKHPTEEGPIFHVKQTDEISPSESPDLMLASPGGFNVGNGGNAVRLNFKHVLSAIKIRTHQTEFFKGRLESLKILNACRDADFHLKPSAITVSNRGNRGPITLVQNGTANIDKNQELISHGGAFFMIPQAINNDNPVELEIRFAPEGKPAQTTKIALSAPDGGWWYQSRTYTYTLSNSESTPNPEWDYTFEVADGNSEFYLSKNNQQNVLIPVKSYSNVRGNTATKKSVDWDYEYSTDGGRTWQKNTNGSINNILSTFSANKSVPAQTDGTNHSLTASCIYENIANWSNEEDIKLGKAPIAGNSYSHANYYDLSCPEGKYSNVGSRSTANCYIVNGPGYYRFPTVYGNGVKNGQENRDAYRVLTNPGVSYYRTNWVMHSNQNIETPYIAKRFEGEFTEKPVIVWTDLPSGVITDVQYTTDYGYTKGAIRFIVQQANIKQGNAVIAIINGKGEALWSWHIWITPYKPGAVLDQHGNPYSDITVHTGTGWSSQVMAMPLGHCTGNSKTWEEKEIQLRFTQKATGTQKTIKLRREIFREREPGDTPLYQWGRTTPIPAGVYNYAGNWETTFPFKEHTRYAGFNETYLVSHTEGTWKSIICPHRLYYKYPLYENYNCWESEIYRNRWDMRAFTNDQNYESGKVLKTVYDPCPVGYAVPTANTFIGFLKNGTEYHGEQNMLDQWNSPIKNSEEFLLEYGYRFKAAYWAYAWQTIFLPVTGCLKPDGPAPESENVPALGVQATGSEGAYWTATYNVGSHKAYSFVFGKNDSSGPYLATKRLHNTNDCRAILPVKE
ncbi:fimbrillin family protein [Bacteroides thetaiotaomicron]|uniref:fimbrillin family protein n=1 Tax=Bacteroides thetaiotaomicron TaxID=818 RepID=UPI0018AB829D|nr:fimbrillin family protein [Bacteroides thetaiotaomicron]MDC2164787.1 fimbrillin family protein [Bacteroides thetaiotaomicron]